jgi:hypothetical protein
MTDETARVRNRNVVGVGAAACAVCCAGPVLAFFGIAGAGALATAATVALAGLAFGMVVLVATILAFWMRRRATKAADPGGDSECDCCPPAVAGDEPVMHAIESPGGKRHEVA